MHLSQIYLSLIYPSLSKYRNMRERKGANIYFVVYGLLSNTTINERLAMDNKNSTKSLEQINLKYGLKILFKSKNVIQL